MSDEDFYREVNFKVTKIFRESKICLNVIDMELNSMNTKKFGIIQKVMNEWEE